MIEHTFDIEPVRDLSHDPEAFFAGRNDRTYFAIDYGELEMAVLARYYTSEGDLYLRDIFNLNGRPTVPEFWWNDFMEYATDLGNFLRDPRSWKRTYRRVFVATLPVSILLFLLLNLVLQAVLGLITAAEVVAFEIVGDREAAWNEGGRGWRKYRGLY